MKRVELLDHGYIELIESWGNDERIIESARMSTGKGFLGWGPIHGNEKCPLYSKDFNIVSSHDGTCLNFKEDTSRSDIQNCIPKYGDEKLLAYLWNNKHATPFEMAGMTIEVKAPIFVFREWHRHRTQSYNEMSARYIPLPDENYVPSIERLMLNSKTNKQAGTIKDSAELTPKTAMDFQHALMQNYRMAESLYQAAMHSGVPKELARLPIPVGRYSKMRASANLRNWLGFLTLRMDKNAQWEIRIYAEEVGNLIRINFPRTWELFIKEFSSK
jgi:thymidylate synthase (FAD)